MNPESLPPGSKEATVYEQARTAAGHGYAVAPVRILLKPDGKKRMVGTEPGWAEISAADVGQVDRWFGPGGTHVGYSYAIDTGKSGIVVVDLDQSGELDGAAEWRKLETPTSRMTVRTRSGGFHGYFAADAGMPVYNTASEIAPGVDTRGVGGIVFGPGSFVEGTDQTYQTIKDTAWIPVHLLPRAPVELINERIAASRAAKRKTTTTRTAVHNPDATAAEQAQARVEAAWAELAEHMAGGFNVALNDLAYEVGRWFATRGLEADDAEAYIIETMADHQIIGEADSTDRGTIRSGVVGGIGNPWEVNEEYRYVDDLIAPPDPSDAPAAGDATGAARTDEPVGLAANNRVLYPDGFNALPEVVKDQVRGLVHRQIAQQFLASAGERAPIPAGRDLATLLAEPDEDEVYLIDQVWPAEGRVFLTAQYKAGKSTTVANVLRSLVDGDPLFGRFAVAPAARRVALIDNELSPRMLRRWFRDQGIRNTDAVTLFDLRGRIGLFDLTDPVRFAEWVEALRGFDVVILDCLGPLIASLGLDENADLRPILTPFSELVGQCGATEAMVVHHMGHSGDRGRGHSSQRDWPDAEWLLRRQEETSKPRTFRASGRDVDVAEADLVFDPQTRHLSLLEPAVKLTNAAAIQLEKLKRVLIDLDASPKGRQGLTKSQIKTAMAGTSSKAFELLKGQIADGYVVATGELADGMTGDRLVEGKQDRFVMSDKARAEWLAEPDDMSDLS